MNAHKLGKVVFFATGNVHKFNEARAVLAEYGLAAAMLRMKGVEIQSDSLLEIAATSAQDAFRQCRLPVIVEDAGLFIDALNGFPGAYAAQAYRTIGNHGILKLMENQPNRQATFRSAIAYCNSETAAVTCFQGEATGTITQTQRKGNNAAFGFDPIFQPDGTPKTFAEMPIPEKNQHSHRAKALHKFTQWYKKKL
jgi:XTP/dITP diphosphohydrolase